MMAKGCCSWAVSARRAAVGLLWETSLEANRRLPSLSLASAASALTEAAGCSAARTKATTLEQVIVARTLNVVLMVCSYLCTAATVIKTSEMQQRLTTRSTSTATENATFRLNNPTTQLLNSALNRGHGVPAIMRTSRSAEPFKIAK